MRGRPRWGGPAGFVIWREYHQPHHRQATEMPQKAAFREGRRIIQAWEADDDVWSEARAASRSGDLVMPCCEVRATAKTSHLGFRFFAHRPVPDNTCLWADQSTEHERLKAAACRAAKEAGFDAQTEVIARDGSWRADCVIQDRVGNPVFAIEMRLSRARADEIERRHAGLRDHVPMVCWFLGPTTTAEIGQASDRPVFKMPRDIAAAERFVADQVKLLLTRHSVWRQANQPVRCPVPFRLVCHWYACPKCNARFVHAPVAWLLRNEAQALQRPEGVWTADLPREAVAQALANYAVRTGRPIAELNRSSRVGTTFVCPTAGCHHVVGDSHIEPDMAHLWPGRDADGVVELAVPPRPDIPSSTNGCWDLPLPELRPWAEPPPDLPGWQRAEHTAREAMDHQDHEELHEARDRQGYERWIRHRGLDAGARSSWADSDWDATKRAFGEARIRELRKTAAAALGSEAAADAWMEQPEPAMDGMTPRTYAMARSDCLALAKPLLAALKTRREGPPVQT